MRITCVSKIKIEEPLNPGALVDQWIIEMHATLEKTSEALSWLTQRSQDTANGARSRIDDEFLTTSIMFTDKRLAIWFLVVHQ